jgi:ribonuclease P protein component
VPHLLSVKTISTPAARPRTAPAPPATLFLKKHADYQRAYKASRKRTTGLFAWFAAARTPLSNSSTTPPQNLRATSPPPTITGPRIGITVPRPIGSAPTRNRIKRRTRAAIRANHSLLTADVDLILHPRAAAADCEFARLTADLIRILTTAQSEFSAPESPAR